MNRKPKSLLVVTMVIATFLAHSQGYELRPTDYFTQAEVDQANTAERIDYLTPEERDIYLYSNLARMYPRKFYELYKAYVIARGSGAKLKSNRYYTSLTRELKSREPEQPVFPDAEMYELAKCWAIESGEKGLVGHDREECPKGFAGENCAYGYATGLEVVMQLLIDEGIPDFGHRVNIFYSDWRGLGAAIRPHRDYMFGAVQNFSRTNDDLKEAERVRKEERARALAARNRAFDTAMEQWSDEEKRAADVSRSVDYLNSIEKDLYFYTNLMRINPRKFKEVIWDQGPFFDRLLPELKEGLHQDDQYQRVSRWLENARSRPAVVPSQERIAALRCIIEKFIAKKKGHSECFNQAGGWRLQTYFSESSFNDVMNILLTSDDFRDLFSRGGTLALHLGEPSVKAFFTPN